jgi:hypothetical protein
MAEYLCVVECVSNLFLAIRLRHFCSKLSFFDRPQVRPTEKAFAFGVFSYNLVSKTRLWHSTARPTLAA